MNKTTYVEKKQLVEKNIRDMFDIDELSGKISLPKDNYRWLVEQFVRIEYLEEEKEDYYNRWQEELKKNNLK